MCDENDCLEKYVKWILPKVRVEWHNGKVHPMATN